MIIGYGQISQQGKNLPAKLGAEMLKLFRCSCNDERVDSCFCGYEFTHAKAEAGMTEKTHE